LEAPAGEFTREQGPPAEQEVREATEEAPQEVIAAQEKQAPEDITEGLPLHKWIRTATQQDGSSAAANWPRDLLRRNP
jgi:hypothetical protein